MTATLIDLGRRLEGEMGVSIKPLAIVALAVGLLRAMAARG